MLQELLLLERYDSFLICGNLVPFSNHSTRIGKGLFGTIYKGYAHKILNHETETLVAIKEVKGSAKDVESHIESQKVKMGKLLCRFSVVF